MAAVASAVLQDEPPPAHALAWALLSPDSCGPRALVTGEAVAAVTGRNAPGLPLRPTLGAGGDGEGDEREGMGAADAREEGEAAEYARASAGPFDPLRLGALVDARDAGGVWWLGQVVDVRPLWAASAFRGTPLDPAAAAAAATAAAAGAAAGGASQSGRPGRPRGSASRDGTATAATAAADEGLVDPADAGGGVGSAWPEVRVHYFGWDPESDDWVPVPPPAVLQAVVAALAGGGGSFAASSS